MKTVYFKKGEEIIKEGNLSDCAYIIGDGRVEVSKKLPNGEKQIIGVLDKNEIFGEMGVIEGKLRMATARCMSPTKLMAISKDQFEKKIESSDPFIRGLIRILSSRVRALQKNQ